MVLQKKLFSISELRCYGLDLLCVLTYTFRKIYFLLLLIYRYYIIFYVILLGYYIKRLKNILLKSVESELNH